jgi:hypothetical protein
MTYAEEKMSQKSFLWWVFIFGGLFLGMLMGVGIYFVGDVIKYYVHRDEFPDMKSPIELLIEMYNFPKLTILKILMGLAGGFIMGIYTEYQKRKSHKLINQ